MERSVLDSVMKVRHEYDWWEERASEREKWEGGGWLTLGRHWRGHSVMLIIYTTLCMA